MSVADEIALVIFSAGRANSISTTNWLFGEDVFLCVPESEADQYPRRGCTLLPHPDTENRLCKKMRWVYDHFRGKKKCVVKVDDDFLFARDNAPYCWTDDNIEEACRITGDEFKQVLLNLYVMAKDLGTPLFGFGNHNRQVYYAQMKRFGFLKAFDASVMGYVLDDKIRVDETLLSKCEYDMQLQAIYHYGNILVDTRFRQIQTEMNANQGGMAAYRTSEVVERSKLILRNKWGDVIRWGARGVNFKF